MSSDFQRRFKGKTEILNKQGINGIVGSSNTPIEKSEGTKILNVNQFQPYQNEDIPYNMNSNFNQYNMNMHELNQAEDNLARQMDNINLDMQRQKMTPSDSKKIHKEKRNSSAVLLAKNNIVQNNNNNTPINQNQQKTNTLNVNHFNNKTKMDANENKFHHGHTDSKNHRNYGSDIPTNMNSNDYKSQTNNLNNMQSSSISNLLNQNNIPDKNQVNNYMMNNPNNNINNNNKLIVNSPENNFISNQHMIMNQKMMSDNQNAQRKNQVNNGMLQGKPDQTHNSKESENSHFSNLNHNLNINNNFNNMGNYNNGMYSNNPGMMNRQFSQGQNNMNMMGGGGMYNNHTPPVIGNNNNMYMNQVNNNNNNGLGIDLEGGLYKNEFSSQQMLNNGQNIINMNMQHQINLNNNQNVNNLFSHPTEEHYQQNQQYKQYNLTDQNDFRGRKGYGMKSGEDYGNRKRKYTPFSVKEYKDLSRTQNYTVGGLGANMNEDWMQKKKKADKAKEYSEVIKDMNSEKIQNQVPKYVDPIKKESNRDKALEFAKGIPRPKAKEEEGLIGIGQNNKNNKNNPKLDTEIRMLEGHLDELEMQHQYYQNKIMGINKQKELINETVQYCNNAKVVFEVREEVFA